jgi:hypothetical protein
MSGQHNNHITYSAADLLRYLDGSMEWGELRALERAMIDDEMLADSVEGYRMMRETYTDEIILAKALNLTTPIFKEKEKEKKIAPVVPFSRFRWLGYAAAASLVVAAGWWVFNVTRPENALPAETNEVTNPAFVNADPADSVITDNQTAVAENSKVATEEQSSKKVEAEGSGEKNTHSQVNDVAKLTEKTSRKPAPSKTVLPEEALAGKNVGTELSDADVRMRNVRAVPSIAASESHTLNFSLMDSAFAVPAAGWKTYQEYLVKSLDLPNVGKTSEIDISLDAAGKITAVSVDSPIGDKEKASIIQTIQSGPAWKNKTGKPAKATIQFQ